MLISTKAGVSHFMAACPFANLGPILPPAATASSVVLHAGMRSIACRIIGLATSFLTPGMERRAAAGTELYVSGEESGEIAIVDVDRGEVVARVPVGKRP